MFRTWWGGESNRGSGTWHARRRGVAVLGAHPKAISERSGRTEIGVTMNAYGHLFEGAQGELTKDLDDLLEEPFGGVR